MILGKKTDILRIELYFIKPHAVKNKKALRVTKAIILCFQYEASKKIRQSLSLTM